MIKIVSEYVGDGVTVVYSYSEIGDNIVGVSVTVDGIQNSNFAMNTATAELIFEVAPTGNIIITAEKYVDNLTSSKEAIGINLDTSGFDNNLDNTIDDLQKLGDAVDDMSSGLIGVTGLYSTLVGLNAGLGINADSNINDAYGVEVTAGGVDTFSTYPAGLATLASLTVDGAGVASAATDNVGSVSGTTYFMGTGESVDSAANGKITATKITSAKTVAIRSKKTPPTAGPRPIPAL